MTFLIVSNTSKKTFFRGDGCFSFYCYSAGCFACVTVTAMSLGKVARVRSSLAVSDRKGLLKVSGIIIR